LYVQIRLFWPGAAEPPALTKIHSQNITGYTLSQGLPLPKIS